MRFKNKTAIITGGGTGIGRAIAEDLGGEGARVLIVGRRLQLLEDSQERLRRKDIQCDIFQADVGSAPDVQRLFDFSRKHFLRLDILVNNASVFFRKEVEKTSEADFEQMLQANFKSVFLMTQNFLPLLSAGGKGAAILNISSVAGTIPPVGQTVYGATKAAVNHLTKGLALELAKYKIRVNALSPGPVDTPIWQTITQSEAEETALKEMLRNKVPLGRIGTPLDIARFASFIVSDDAEWLTGSIINLDGGRGLLT